MVTGVKAELLDTGNLILFNKLGTKIWQSFRYPTNTFLPVMNMESLELTSWEGCRNLKYKFKVDQGNNKKYVIVDNVGVLTCKGPFYPIIQLKREEHYSIIQWRDKNIAQ